MYLGYQNGKIKFYTEQPLDKDFYNLEKVEETQDEYVLDGESYVLKDEVWEEKQALIEKERVARLSVTKREMFLALYQAVGVTPDMLKAQITDPAALIEFEYANDYYRGNPLVDVVGATLGITPEQLDLFFDTKDYTHLCVKPDEELPTEENVLPDDPLVTQDDEPETGTTTESTETDDPSVTHDDPIEVEDENTTSVQE